MKRMNQTEMLSIADFFVILWKRKTAFLVTFVIVMAAAVAYLFLATKYYKLTGSFYVGRFQGLLIEEGEFVAAKLRDYSFMVAALEEADVELDIPVSRLERLVSTEVVNEVKKVQDVGLVKLTVEYKDREKTLLIYRALADHLIRDHQRIIDRAANVLHTMGGAFEQEANALRESLEADDAATREALGKRDAANQIVGFQLLSRTVAEKRRAYKETIKDMYYMQLEAGEGPKTYVTRMSAPPVLPDEHFEPKRTLVLILGVILAGLTGMMAAFGLHFFETSVKPKL